MNGDSLAGRESQAGVTPESWGNLRRKERCHYHFPGSPPMQCPACLHHNSRVLESRSSEGGQSIRRRRECLICKHRFTTYERIEYVPMTVIKQDGQRESFDRSKLLRGLLRACEKTAMASQRLERIVEEIEAQLHQVSKREITSEAIGQLVLQYLREENEVAYIRFASVYGRFQGITDFVNTLNQLQQVSPTVLETWDDTDPSHSEDSDPSEAIAPLTPETPALVR